MDYRFSPDAGRDAQGRVVAGRGATLLGRDEISDLKPGLDFRRIEFRREVFHRFLQFHLRYRSHPGAVYYLLPFLRDHYGWDREQALWFAFLNGNTQHALTSLWLMTEFPNWRSDAAAMNQWVGERWPRLAWDTDRRYWKAKLGEAVKRYQGRVVGAGSQAAYFDRLCQGDEQANFRAVWHDVRANFYGFGRLSAFSYLEYLRILGLPVEADTLFLRDIDGSFSHRNGLAIVLGRDDLDKHDSNPAFPGYTPEVMDWLELEADTLLAEARQRTPPERLRDANYFTLESTLCCYKSWHRPNRRYPNVYNDMLCERIRDYEAKWPGDLRVELFWEARRQALPERLRLEANPHDFGVAPEKQNHYRNTGQVIMMEVDDPVFANEYSRCLTEAR